MRAWGRGGVWEVRPRKLLGLVSDRKALKARRHMPGLRGHAVLSAWLRAIGP
ncbi:hypothetical protein TIFTF001_030960 [Ficus carica]|uniref:Uncharacterized protein n=1 Tax=Ficus carica TaxID=3494 RepID=A0AA88DVH1_FICCA|nr:hypothetical protein TIFTF001_030960 [Ficus carica]